MGRVTFFIFLGIIFLSVFGTALALEISEIMYDLPGSDEGREWVEVFNNSAEAVDLSKLKFFEADTNHKITFVEGSSIIPPQGYAVIVSDPIKFKVDWASFSGITASSGTPPSAVDLFDSSFSLSNTGETLAIKSEEQALDQYVYLSSLGGAGNGKSLQKINGTWIASLPTPGRENIYSPPIATPPPSSQKVIPMPSPQPLSISENGEGQGVRGRDLERSEEIEEIPSSFSWLHFVTNLILVFAGVVLVRFVRQKKKISPPGSEFEILDK